MDQNLQSENIIKLLKIESLSDERKVQIVNQVSDLVLKRLMLRLLESLDEEKKKQFSECLEKGDQGAISQFVDQNAPEFSNWINEELNKVKNELGEVK